MEETTEMLVPLHLYKHLSSWGRGSSSNEGSNFSLDSLFAFWEEVIEHHLENNRNSIIVCIFYAFWMERKYYNWAPFYIFNYD